MRGRGRVGGIYVRPNFRGRRTKRAKGSDDLVGGEKGGPQGATMLRGRLTTDPEAGSATVGDNTVVRHDRFQGEVVTISDAGVF